MLWDVWTPVLSWHTFCFILILLICRHHPSLCSFSVYMLGCYCSSNQTDLEILVCDLCRDRSGPFPNMLRDRLWDPCLWSKRGSVRAIPQIAQSSSSTPEGKAPNNCCNAESPGAQYTASPLALNKCMSRPYKLLAWKWKNRRMLGQKGCN